MKSEDNFVAFIQELDMFSIGYSTNVSMKDYSYFKSGGVAKVVISPAKEDDLALTVRALRSHQVTFKVVGRTTNLLFVDGEDYAALISTKELKKLSYDEINGYVYAETGVDIGRLSRFFLMKRSRGFEGLEGIPGTLGGAVFMNASAYGSSLSQTLVSVRVWDEEVGFSDVPLAHLKLGYRTSIFHEKNNNKIIVGATFKLQPGDCREIYKKMCLYHNKRHKYQEFMYPTLGSVFAGSVYRELAKSDFRYYLVSSIYYFFNYRFKIFRRESPDDRTWLNDFTIKFFKLEFDDSPFSNKDMNTLINNGQHTDAYLDYIDKITKLTENRLKLENEIVRGF